MSAPRYGAALTSTELFCIGIVAGLAMVGVYAFVLALIL